MQTLTATVSALTHALSWALLFSLWQGLLIYGFLYLLLKMLPNINARVKIYLVAWGILRFVTVVCQYMDIAI